MRNSPVEMRHLLTDTAPANEIWESLLQRLADKTSTANTASTLIDALTTPLPGGGAQEPAAKHRRLSASRRSSAAHQELVDSLTTPNSTIPANKLDSLAFSDIGLLKCRQCGAEYYFTAAEQAFYAAKNFDDKPKSCKKKAEILPRWTKPMPLLLLPLPLLAGGAATPPSPMPKHPGQPLEEAGPRYISAPEGKD